MTSEGQKCTLNRVPLRFAIEMGKHFWSSPIVCESGCTSRRRKDEVSNVHFYCSPADSYERHRWLLSIRKPITMSDNTRICSLHFPDMEKTIENPVSTVFPWSKKLKQHWPPLSRLPLPPPTKKAKLDIEQQEKDEGEPRKDEREIEIEELRAKIKCLKEEKVERFGLRRFMGSGIRDFTLGYLHIRHFCV